MRTTVEVARRHAPSLEGQHQCVIDDDESGNLRVWHTHSELVEHGEEVAPAVAAPTTLAERSTRY